MFRCVSKLVALALVVFLPYSLMAADMQGAMLYATNSVAVNGATVTNTSAIFPGDKVSVADNGAATITLNGTSILVPKLTALTFNGNSVSLEPRAAVSVTTSAGMAAEIKNIKISPAKNGPAQYQVARYNGRVFVAAKQGDVLVVDPTGSHVLPEGKTTSIADPEPQKPGTVPTATTGVGVTALPQWVAVLIGLAGVGAAAAVGFATTGAPASPTTP